ncbi:MAG: hypothetical protein ACXVRK_00670 [Gaiellaceae bacterium]
MSAPFPRVARGPNPDDERVAEIKLLFSERGCKMFAPRRLGGSKNLFEPVTWVVRYAGKDLYGVCGAVDAYGIGRTPLDAAEDAWVNFQAEQPAQTESAEAPRAL